MTEPTAVPISASDDQHATVEALVRAQLAKALGGKRGMLEGAIPTIGFTLTWITTHDLELTLWISGGLATAALLLRIVQRSTIQYVFNAIFGIAIAAIFALKSGKAEDAFLPGLIMATVYSVLLVGSVLIRWPVIGFMIGSVTGDPTAWHRDNALVKLCSRLTLVLAAPSVVKMFVYYPLWKAGEAGWLGVAKIALGWPMYLGSLAVMAWMLGRDHTPIQPQHSPPADVDDVDDENTSSTGVAATDRTL